MNINKSILKYITGREAAEEKDVLDDWKNQADENLAGIKNIIEMQQQLSALSDYKDVDQHKAWNNIEQKMTSSEPKTSFKLYKIAAALVFVIVALFAIKTFSDTYTTSEQVIVFTGSRDKNIQLEDGSVVLLEDESILNQTSTRNVNLQGTAYFDVAKDPATPFVVHTHHGTITVLGTEFNIHTYQAKTQIYVSEGKVKVNYQNKEYILEIGQMITLTDVAATTANHPGIQPSVWKNKILTFENKSMRYVLESISIYYNLDLEWSDKIQSDQCKINTVFKDETIEEVMKELSLISGLKYELRDSKIIIKSFKC